MIGINNLLFDFFSFIVDLAEAITEFQEYTDDILNPHANNEANPSSTQGSNLV